MMLNNRVRARKVKYVPIPDPDDENAAAPHQEQNFVSTDGDTICKVCGKGPKKEEDKKGEGELIT